MAAGAVVTGDADPGCALWWFVDHHGARLHVPFPERAEEILLAGDMPCPRCRGVLRPFGKGRTRIVRGVGADTVTVTPAAGPLR